MKQQKTALAQRITRVLPSIFGTLAVLVGLIYTGSSPTALGPFMMALWVLTVLSAAVSEIVTRKRITDSARIGNIIWFLVGCFVIFWLYLVQSSFTFTF